jgi:putative phosphoesterase
VQIGIISDTHSRHTIVRTALTHLRERDIELVLHCGDIEDGDTVALFAGFTAHFVLGNCDSDPAELRTAVRQIGGTLHAPFGDLDLDGKRVAWIHGDDRRLFEHIEQSRHFDYLFYGHSHRAEQHRTGPTLVVNPGALHRARPKTFVVLDISSGELESIVLE